MAHHSSAVAAYRDGNQWHCAPLPPGVLDNLGVLMGALRSQPPEGGPFVAANVDDEFFLIARARGGGHIDLLLSDLTAAVEYPLAEQVLERLGEEPPDEDELDEVWPLGDLDLFDDLGLGEDEMGVIVDDLDAYAEEMLDEIMDRLGLGDQYDAALSLTGAR
jgi:putative tRNA adenosine deaminase-associated protein